MWLVPAVEKFEKDRAAWRRGAPCGRLHNLDKLGSMSGGQRGWGVEMKKLDTRVDDIVWCTLARLSGRLLGLALKIVILAIVFGVWSLVYHH
jgi:hypothetical protein